jgi:hypothetical protein
MGQQLIDFGSWMRDNPETKIFRLDQAHHGHNITPTPMKYMTIFEVNQYFVLAEEIREKAEKLQKLTQQKERFGLK